MSDYLKEGFIDEVKGCLGGRGGQENVIESIKVNGVGQTVDENKAVNIPVPTKTSDLDNDSGYQTNSEVSSTVAAEVAKIVADAPEDFDTLKEMSDWISQHEDSAAAMNSAILKNKEDISALYTSKADVSDVQTVEASVDELNSNLIEQKMLGWTVPKECPIQNEVSGNQFIQKVGRVDLGSLEFDSSSAGFFYSSEVENMPIPISGGKSGYCSVYGSFYVVSYQMIINQDKIITYSNSSITGKKSVCIRDTSYTDATTFKNAMKGQYLYHELATPITMTIDGNEVTERLNESLGDYGLVNKATVLLQGGYRLDSSNKLYLDTDTKKVSTDILECIPNKAVSYKTDVAYDTYIGFLDSNKIYISTVNSKSNEYTTIVPPNAKYFFVTVYNQPANITPETAGRIGVYINNAIDELKNDLSVKKFELVAGALWLCVSGKHCVLTLNGYNLTESTHFDKLEEYQPYLVARNVVSKGDSVCIAAVEPNGNINASDLVVGTQLTGQLFGEISWIANI